MTFGERLKQHRTERNLSLDALGARLEVTRMYLSDVERGKRNALRGEMLKKVCRELELSQDETYEMYELSASNLGRFPEDIAEYLNSIPEAKAAVRRAIVKGLGGEFWKGITG